MTGIKAFNWLVENGYLARLIPKRTRFQLDTSGVRIKGGEFAQDELQHAVDKEELTRIAVDEIISEGQERSRWLIFASGVEHAEHVTEILKEKGIPVEVVHSKTGDDRRDLALVAFREGRLRALVNNNVLTTGIDVPGIDLIGVLRPTQSAGLWVQMLGRGTRPCVGKNDCMVLDFAGNTKRLGPINDPIIPRKKGKGGNGTAPVKACEVCGVYNHASATSCAFCGAEFPRHLKIKQFAATDEVMVLESPVVQTFKVDRIVYTPKYKLGKLPSLQVSYYCQLNLFREWVCLEHSGFPLHKAHDWWRKRSLRPPPQSVSEAIPFLKELKEAATIDVWLNKKYPEIVSHNLLDR